MLSVILQYRLDLLIFFAIIAMVARYMDRRTRPVAVPCRSRILTSAAIVTVALLAAITADTVCQYERGRLRHTIEGFAPTYALELENAGHASVTFQSGSDDPLYLNLIERQKSWLWANPAVADIYTLRRAPDGGLAFVVDSETDYDRNGRYEGNIEKRTPIGEIYTEPSELMWTTLAGIGSFDDVPQSDRWGTWVSAYVPLRNHNGDVEAMLGVDFPATQWIHVLLLTRAGILGIFLALIAGLVVTSASIRMHRAEVEAHREIAEQKESHAIELQEALRRLKSYKFAIDTHAVLCITDHQGVLIHVNDRFCCRSGYSESELIGKTHRLVSSGQHPHAFWADMWQTIAAGSVWHGEICNQSKDGVPFWLDTTIVPYRDSQSVISQFISIGTDITSRKRFETELMKAARLDKLTGLPNRFLFQDRLQQAIERYRRLPGYHFALMFLDFDRFKLINDCLGHTAGDLLLQQIAVRLRDHLRSGDSLAVDIEQTTVARLGGDEFVVLVDAISQPEDAGSIAQRLLSVCDAPYQIGEHFVRSSASIGIVCCDPRYATAEEMLRDADIAMYEAKSQGRARFVMFDASMQQAVQERLEIENDLRAAVGTDQFFLVYQPIVSLEDGILRSAEALIRWNHPTRGLMPPDQFIGVAEETRLILPLTIWIIERACAQFADWKQNAPGRTPRNISINLSRVQLSEPGIVEELLRITRANGMQPDELQLEVTESEIMQNRDSAVKILKSLKYHGFALAMDDFGTGHSSLACLHQFPFDVIKIDRTFVANLSNGRKFVALANAVVTLADNLGLVCVAEGIEDSDQIALLQSMGCSYGQGYYFGRPVPPEGLISGDWNSQKSDLIAGHLCLR